MQRLIIKQLGRTLMFVQNNQYFLIDIIFIIYYYVYSFILQPPNMETKSQVLKSGHFITRCKLNNAWQSKEPLNESR